MRKAIVAVSVVVFSMGAVAAEEAPIPKEGSYSSLSAGSATSKVLPVGKDRVQVTWEALGVQTGDDAKGITHNASFRCIGSLRALNGEFESFTNACVFTRPDGDQMFWVESGTGRVGAASKGTGTIVGGTGKLAGITGGGEWTRYVVRPAAEGTFQTVTRAKVSYKLP
jgi:hypothetical protein